MLRQLENDEANHRSLKKQKSEKKGERIAALLAAIHTNNLMEVQRVIDNPIERPTYQEISENLSKPIFLFLEENDDSERAPILKSVLIAYEQEITPEETISAFYHYCKKNDDQCAVILAYRLLMSLGLFNQLTCELVESSTLLHEWAMNKVKAAKYLIAENVCYNENEKFYNMIACNLEPSSIVKSIVTLVHYNIQYKDNSALYSLVWGSTNPERMAICCTLIWEKLSFEQNERYYKMLSTKEEIGLKILKKAFANLKRSHIPDTEYIMLCKSFIIDEDCSDVLSKSILSLTKWGFSYDKNVEIYEIFIENVCDVENREEVSELIVSIKMLAEMNFSSKEIVEICEIIKDLEEGKEQAEEILSLLIDFGMESSDFPKGFFKNKFFVHDKLIFFVLEKLRSFGFHFETHPNVFEAIFNILNEMSAPYQLVLEITENISNYAKDPKIKMQENKEQLAELDRIIQISREKLNELTEGPLNKSIGTQKIEKLLHALSVDYDSNHDYISFNQMEEYILTIPGQEVINLSLLLRNANLSHMVLSQDLINNIERIIIELIPELEMEHENEVVRLLPKIQQAAFNEYTSQKYRNINRLFRSEALDLKSKKAFHDDPSKNRLCCFLLGCLLNDAVNRLRCLQEKIPEKEAFDALINRYMRISQYTEIIENEEDLHRLLIRAHEEAVITEEKYDSLLKKVHHTWVSFYEKKILDRGERLDEEIIQRRTANAWRFPALTSFSIFKEGSDYFHEEDTQRTILEGAPYFCVINEEEGEVLLAQGKQVTTFQTPEYLISTIRCSPSLEPKYHYWSEQGLRYAYEHYFSKEYQDEESMIECGGEKVMRPNHNIVHTYRVMLLVERVVAYFAEYANDLKFKIFCQDFTEKALEWLRVGAVFSVTGRENERSASENREQYDSYRIASGQHFLEFVQKTSPYDIIMKERIHNVVRYMGNPHYESTLNQHENVNEQENRNFYHRILTVAHKLDLPRCFTAKELQKSLKCIDVLSESSESQQEALEEMIRYNIALIKIHGDSLCCDIDFDGNWVDCNIEYQPSYGKVSNSLKALFERTALVPEPRRRYHNP